MSPWLDMRVVPLEVVLNNLRSQQHRRFIKTHLPLDGLPYNENQISLYRSRCFHVVMESLHRHEGRDADASKYAAWAHGRRASATAG